MKKFTALALVLTLLLTAISMAACENSGRLNINAPENLSTDDELNPTQASGSVSDSKNVNGRHYTATLKDFNDRFNSIMMDTGGRDYLYFDKWQKQGEPKLDANSVKYQLYYYEMDIFVITASVEVETEMIMNVGCGTTMNTFVNMDGEIPNSDRILRAAAIMAASAAGFSQKSVNVLQDIFYRIIFGDVTELWYEENVFSMTTKSDKSNSENDTMLLRIFPITNELKAEWNLQSYEEYAASNPTK